MTSRQWLKLSNGRELIAFSANCRCGKIFQHQRSRAKSEFYSTWKPLGWIPPLTRWLNLAWSSFPISQTAPSPLSSIPSVPSTSQPEQSRRKHQLKIGPARLVFIDETWAKTNMARTHG